MSQDFSKAKIYKITNDYNDDVYVGSTCNTLVRRFSMHKSDSKQQCKMNFLLYQLINNIGFERFRIQLIENYPCEDKYQLRQREGYWIKQLGTLNKLIAGRTIKEWEEDNKDKLKAKYDKYEETHKEQRLEKKKEIICECGCVIQKQEHPRHIKTQKHNNLMSIKFSETTN